MLNRIYLVCFVSGCLIGMSRGQRPSFAGARPPGGLSQKDKYHGTPNTAAENSNGLDIANRFGDSNPQSETVTLAYGASQRPPTGVDLVRPMTSYVPIASSTAATPAISSVPQFAVVNRFGATEGSLGVNPTIASTGAASTTTTITSTSNALPVEAYGDQDWVNHLSRLPVDKQPFWFINYQAIEAQRNSSRPSGAALETRGSFFGG